MKRILQVIKGLDRGGAERLLVDVLRYRDADAFDNEVAYLLRGSDAMVPSIDELDIPVRCLDAGRGPGWMRRLRTLVSERSIDLVHVHSPFAAIGARLSLHGSEPRMVYTEHSVWEGYPPATRWGTSRRMRATTMCSPCLSTFASRSAIRGRSPVGRCRWSRRFITGSIGRRSSTRPSFETAYEMSWASRPTLRFVGCVANFTPQKAHPVLLEAMLMVRDSVPAVRLVLVGGGPNENAIRSKVHQLGLDSTVVFTGVRADAPRIVTCFDVFALSSVNRRVVDGPDRGDGARQAGRRDGCRGVAGSHPTRGRLNRAGGGRTQACLGPHPTSRRPSPTPDDGEIPRHRAADFDVRRTAKRIEAVYSELLTA